MATTAKPVRGGKFADTGDEDIAAIAKQISDHAEAIYQTWKARGLAPSEILSCHSGPTEAFGKSLGKSSQMANRRSTSPQVNVDLLSQAPEMSNNNLEKLVNNFVVEDKARVAAARQSAQKNVPPSIQFALQKFENTRKDVVDATKEIKEPMKKPAKPVKPPGLTVTERPVLLQSWPLKNKLNERANVVNKGAALLMDEVSREEERLINALKSGTVLSNSGVENFPKNHVTTSNDYSIRSTNGQGFKETLNYLEDEFLKSGDESKIRKPINDLDEFPKRCAKPTAFKESIPNTSTAAAAASADAVRPTALSENIVWKNGQRPAHHALRAGSPIRPFLTRGSVAERVLIFERCPSELRTPRLLQKESAKPQVKLQPKPLPPHTTLQRHIKENKNVFIPKFYFPLGKPISQTALDTTLHRIQSAFNTFPNSQVPRDSFHHVVTACSLPMYWRAPLYLATPSSPSGHVDGHKFIDFWKKMVACCHDAASRFIHVCTKGDPNRRYLRAEDLVPLVQDVVERHPGLAFLRAAREFHSRYVHTVIARVFYTVNRSWSGRISIAELRRSDFLQVVQLLEEEEDINQITAYFSYEHFYVIYCKFWELDRDHDLYIDKQDLARHNDHALSSRMIDRIFSGCVTRGSSGPQARMSYTEFVWFLLAEEDKTHPTAIEYWFRCMDMDGDGVLSMYELEYFYDEQTHRMDSIGIETLPFEDCLCQMLDMIRPAKPGCITLSDLKKCKMTPIFFDTFFNLEKYLDHEQRDPFANQREQDGDELSDWDRFAAEEYELLVAEEGADAQEDQCSYDEDEMAMKLENLEAELDYDQQPCNGSPSTSQNMPNISSLFEIYRNQHGPCYESDQRNGFLNNSQCKDYKARNYLNERLNKTYNIVTDKNTIKDSDDCSI